MGEEGGGNEVVEKASESARGDGLCEGRGSVRARRTRGWTDSPRKGPRSRYPDESDSRERQVGGEGVRTWFGRSKTGLL